MGTGVNRRTSSSTSSRTITTDPSDSGRAVGGRTVWLASFPKSGNTWVRAIITALGVDPHLFGVNSLGAGLTPHHLWSAAFHFGLDPRWFDRSELDQLRRQLVVTVDRSRGGPGHDAPFFRKTHEVFRLGSPGAEPFPLDATRAAVLVVRDPRDVACAYAPFFGLDIDSAIDAMATASGNTRGSPAWGITAQPWGTWSTHVRSWLDADVPFPVHVVRYEDLHTDTVGTLAPVLEAVGLECTREQLAEAVESTGFERLQALESSQGFRESSPHAEKFFRQGRAGGWRDELTPHQVATIELHHREMMSTLGYTPISDPLNLQPLPTHLGIAVRLGTVAMNLENGRRVASNVTHNDSATLARFGPKRRILVEEGRRITLEWPVFEGDDPSDDVSWVLQGWGAVLAFLQRGEIPLHASSVRIGGRVVAIAGLKGAGKSTTSLGLSQRGHELLVDDTTFVHLDDSVVRITPFRRNVHLLPDAASQLGIDFGSLDLLAGARQKAAWRPPEPPAEPFPIDAIVILKPDSSSTESRIEEVRGAERISLLRDHVTRGGLSEAMLGPQRYFDLVSQLATSTPILLLRRPATTWTLEQVMDLIEAETQLLGTFAQSATGGS